MARLTSAQLAAELESARVEIQRLRSQVASLEAQRASSPAPRPQRFDAKGEPTPFQLACAKARELAMRSGRSVKVSA